MRRALLILYFVVFAGFSTQTQRLEAAEPPLGAETSKPGASDLAKTYRPFIERFSSSEDAEKLRARLPFDRIALRRTPCFGSCPVYEVVFHRDGKAEYHAQEHVPNPGQYVGKVGLGVYARLCYLVEGSHFFDFKPSYRARWTDDATCIVTVTQGGKETAVSDYGSVGPIELWAIQQTLDSIRNGTDWTLVK